MRPTQHPSNNDVLRAPPGVPIEECVPLAITRVVYTDGRQGVFSYWRPSDAERELLARGGSVRFEATGVTHPPIYLGVEGDGGDAVTIASAEVKP